MTDTLRAAATLYREQWRKRLELGAGGRDGCIVCNSLTAPLGDFFGAARHEFCTNIAASVAEVVAEVLVRIGVDLQISPIAELDAAGSDAPSGCL